MSKASSPSSARCEMYPSPTNRLLSADPADAHRGGCIYKVSCRLADTILWWWLSRKPLKGIE